MSKPTIEQQAAAVELAFVNQRGHVRNLVALVDKGKRQEAELQLARMHLPALEAAVATLKFMAANADALRAKVAGSK